MIKNLLTKTLSEMKKLFYLVIVFTNIITISLGQAVIKTPTGSSVSYDYEEEMSQEQIAI